jgi:hypothetical protein
MEKVIEIKVEDIKRAFEEASDSAKKSILTLFPQLKEALPVTDRVKTFEDACHESGIDPEQYMSKYEDEPADVIAYMKLRVICKALNEGWTPQFVKGEFRYFPYFYLYTNEEISRMSEEEKSRVVFRSYYSASAYGGVSYAYAYNDSAYVFASVGSRLAFKTSELAEYAGKQFIDLWADFCLTKK